MSIKLSGEKYLKPKWSGSFHNRLADLYVPLEKTYKMVDEAHVEMNTQLCSSILINFITLLSDQQA